MRRKGCKFGVDCHRALQGKRSFAFRSFLRKRQKIRLVSVASYYPSSSSVSSLLYTSGKVSPSSAAALAMSVPGIPRGTRLRLRPIGQCHEGHHPKPQSVLTLKLGPAPTWTFLRPPPQSRPSRSPRCFVHVPLRKSHSVLSRPPQDEALKRRDSGFLGAAVDREWLIG